MEYVAYWRMIQYPVWHRRTRPSLLRGTSLCPNWTSPLFPWPCPKIVCVNSFPSLAGSRESARNRGARSGNIGFGLVRSRTGKSAPRVIGGPWSRTGLEQWPGVAVRSEVADRESPSRPVPCGDRNQNVMVCFHCSDYRGPQVDLKLTGGCARAVILEKRVSELADSTLSSCCSCFFGQIFQIVRCQDCLNFKVKSLF